MKKNINKWFSAKLFLIIVFVGCMLPYQQLSAQNRKVGGAPSKPAANKPAANKPAPSKPAANKPAANNNKPDVKRPDANNNKPDVKKPDANKNVADRKGDINNSGNKTTNIGSNNNKTNIDNSKKNVNVNVDKSKDIHVNNSRNTAVRHNSRPYSRPPYRYGGHSYRCYHPYYFHPYRPFVWGPMWHPWGFFIATLAATAIILTVDNNMPGDLDMAYNTVPANYPFGEQSAQSGPAFVFGTANVVSDVADQYYYDAGVYYIKGDGGYTVVAAPVGASIKTLPTGYETVSIDDNTKNYYYGGAFYEKTSKGYTVVAPTAGAVVEHVSDGGEDVKMGDVTYVKLGDTYFQPIQQDGKDMYEVADVQDDK